MNREQVRWPLIEQLSCRSKIRQLSVDWTALMTGTDWTYFCGWTTTYLLVESATSLPAFKRTAYFLVFDWISFLFCLEQHLIRSLIYRFPLSHCKNCFPCSELSSYWSLTEQISYWLVLFIGRWLYQNKAVLQHLLSCFYLLHWKQYRYGACFCLMKCFPLSVS